MTHPRKIVVLGSNSFSGQDFVDLALDKPGVDVIGVSRSQERSAMFNSYRKRADLSRFSYHQMDMNDDMDALLAMLDETQPDWIINFAAQSEVAPSWEHPEHWFQTNTVALARLVNHLSRQNYLQRYLHISSPEAFGNCIGSVKEDTPDNPSTPYAASKAAADMLLKTYQRQFGFPLLTVRATNVYGAGQQLFKIIPRSAIYIRSGQTIELHGGGTAVKSYIHIRDVSEGEWAILEEGRIGESYNLSPPSGVAVRDVVAEICKMMDVRFEDATRSVDERPGQDAAYVIDSSKAQSELGWRANVSLSEGLRSVVDWVDGNWSEIKEQPLNYQHKV